MTYLFYRCLGSFVWLCYGILKGLIVEKSEKKKRLNQVRIGEGERI